jgi:hypothetical protein
MLLDSGGSGFKGSGFKVLGFKVLESTFHSSRVPMFERFQNVEP